MTAKQKGALFTELVKARAKGRTKAFDYICQRLRELER